jgi:hypothetical protein
MVGGERERTCSGDPKAIEWSYVSSGRARRDEPGWRGLLRVEEVELNEMVSSPN